MVKPAQSTKEKSHNKCALVTGGSGYIGSKLIEGLIADDWKVHLILRPTSSLNQLSKYESRLVIHLHHGSTDEMLDIFALAKPDVVFHLAAMANAEHRSADVEQMIISNVLFSSQLVEGMARNGVKNLVNTETFWQHAQGTDQYEPVCLYAATKQAFHDILYYYTSTSAIQAISLVLFDTYGPDDPRKKLFNFLKLAAFNNKPIDMTPGQQIVDMSHVDDVVAAYLQAAEMLLATNIAKFATYAVTSGRRMKLKELVELIIRETGISIHPNWGGRPYRPNEVMVPWLGEPLPGWRPNIELEKGIREIFNER